MSKRTLIILLLLFNLFPSKSAFAEFNAVVLSYHRVAAERWPSTNVSLKQFTAQLRFLEQEKFNVWSLEKIISYLDQRKPIPDKTIAITFDDAYLSVYENAYPELRSRGYPFTVFVATNALDKGYHSNMNWDQLRDMAKNGAEIGNHSATHDYLILQKSGETLAQWKLRVRSDIAKAQHRIKVELGISASLFAYPYGEYSVALKKIIQELNLTAFGQHSGAIGRWSDRQALPRFPINERYSELEGFRDKVYSLALPVNMIHPADPVITSNNPPFIELGLMREWDVPPSLNCFASNGHRVRVALQDASVYRVTSDKALVNRRSRYNCTALSKKKGRYYWYSALWIRPDILEN